MTSEKNATDKPVLCIGITPAVQRTLRFDRLKLGEVNRAKMVKISAAGKATNVALVLKLLGDEPLVTGFIGGETGGMIEGFLRMAGIATEFVTMGQPTRVCVTVMDEGTGQITELVEESPAPTDSDWTSFDNTIACLLPGAGMVAISGGLPPGSADMIYASVTQKVATLGLPLLIDTKGEPLLNTLQYQPLLVKMNRQELAVTCGFPAEDDDKALKAARHLIARGAQWVLVTHSGEPAWLLNGETLWKLAPPKVKVVNPIGSGDSVTGGMAFALRQGKSMLEAAQFGLACGSANALTLTPGEVRPEDVHSLLPRVRILS